MSAVDVHAVVTGREGAPVVVLSNSLGSTHRMWDAQIPALEQNFRVVRITGVAEAPPRPFTYGETQTGIIAVMSSCSHRP